MKTLDEQIATTRADAAGATDPITGLAGPDALLTALDLAIDLGAPERRTVALLLVDVELLDHPSEIAATDRAFRAIAGALAAACRREADEIFRTGPHRFAAILPAASAQAGRSVARRAVAAIDEAGIDVRVWAGVAEWPFDGATGEELLERAHPTSEVAEQLREETVVVDRQRRCAEELSATTLASTVEQRAPWLDGHAGRVARLASEVGQMLDLEPTEIEAIGRAALVHDVGMIALPDTVLMGTGPLDESGWELVKRTPDTAARIVSGYRSLGHLAPVVRAHRERWDGSGYPQGLVGEAIPLAARILAVCEAYDAMTSARPYRGPLTVRDAGRELEQAAGTAFDPAVVAALTRVLDRHRTGMPIAPNGGEPAPRSRLFRG